eukprot:COSAG06_NODE_1941_length_8015_cov_2.703007_12_plen_44_part_00
MLIAMRAGGQRAGAGGGDGARDPRGKTGSGPRGACVQESAPAR